MSYDDRTGGNHWRREGTSLPGFFRDRENGWIFGVCAGISEYLGIQALVVRVITVASLILFTLPTALLYIAATILVRERPLTYRGVHAEHDFWRRHGRDDHWSAS